MYAIADKFVSRDATMQDFRLFLMILIPCVCFHAMGYVFQVQWRNKCVMRDYITVIITVKPIDTLMPLLTHSSLWY